MYNYQQLKPEIFKEENQQTFLEVLAEVEQLLKVAGAFKADRALPTGDSWLGMAYIDRLVELGIIKEVPTNGFGIDRVFVKK